MLAFAELITKGDFIVEIGGHIGYMTMYFAKLTGPRGKVIVFEPGPNNLPYIKRNTESLSNVVVIDKAVTDFVGKAPFYVENLSGQNDSLLENFRICDDNIEAVGIKGVQKSVVEVNCTTLDGFLNENDLPSPSFVKIDAEGAELSILNGMQNTLRAENIALMVEVRRNSSEVHDLLTAYGFQLYQSDGRALSGVEKMGGNIFCLKEENSRKRLLFRDRRFPVETPLSRVA